MATDRNDQPPSGWCASPNAIRLRSALRLSRRNTLMGVAAGAALGGSAWADAPVAGVVPAAPLMAPDHFMALSRRLTDRPTLDARIGAALLDELLKVDAKRPQQLRKLHALMEKTRPKSGSAFAREAEKADPAFRDVIREILAGWYRGVANGRVVVYRSALMFDITKDAIFPKTYAAGGPFYWTSKPPEVAPPTGTPALPPIKLVIEPT
ncbi:sorbitol dehydrogenase family protein [Acetobacter estunensis]|uniref:sorbitol dehydrogenase family protein n=1 Tax=Acetobacter estunensis TaxID=104097 RepID=UPI001C2D4A9F|nr:sorbitol dehydrogenase family protein [Acetobacter estunensis]MBV1837202.1 sorbitol dehydrogenase family protein [Acetobacter estunensis]